MQESVTKVNYPFVMDIEKDFDAEPYNDWFISNWKLSIYISMAYVIAILSLKAYMRTRERYDMHYLLGLWNVGLAIFSTIGFLRTFQECYGSIVQHGLLHTICNKGFFRGPSGFWVLLYTLSKVYELGDTLFIVLRKQKLIFLHFYHHPITLIYAFISYMDFTSLFRYAVVSNFFVHSLMYTYYALRAFKVKIPNFVNIVITLSQIVQMVVGTSLYFYAYFLQQGRPCQISQFSNMYGLVMYISYLVLFSNFFYKTYIQKVKTL